MENYRTTFIRFDLALPEHHKKLSNFYRLRKTVFIDQLGWDLHEIQGAELDQYDCAWAVYVLVENAETGEIEGGARLLRTDREAFISQLDEDPTSYMIRDAFLGRLDGLPSSVTFQAPPQDPCVWELTRLAAKPEVSKHVMLAVNDFLVTQSATECLALSAPVLFKVAKKMGFDPEPIGAMQSNESGSFLAFRCHVNYQISSVAVPSDTPLMFG